MINAFDLLVGLFSALHLKGQTFNLWLSCAYSPLISQRRYSTSQDPQARHLLPVMGCCWSVNPVTGTICRLSFKRWLTGGEVTSYWQREVESERAGVAGNESLFRLTDAAACCCWWIPEEWRRILANAASEKSWLEFIIKHQGIKNCEMRSCFTDTLEYMWNMMNSKQFFLEMQE